MSNEAAFIQQLLAAEKSAKEVVEKARKRRIKRLQQAKDEAKNEIGSIEKEYSEKFKEYEAQTLKSNAEALVKIKQETMQFLRQMLKDAVACRENIISDLIDLVMDVQPAFHRNFKPIKFYDDEDYEPRELTFK